MACGESAPALTFGSMTTAVYNILDRYRCAMWQRRVQSTRMSNPTGGWLKKSVPGAPKPSIKVGFSHVFCCFFVFVLGRASFPGRGARKIMSWHECLIIFDKFSLDVFEIE